MLTLLYCTPTVLLPLLLHISHVWPSAATVAPPVDSINSSKHGTPQLVIHEQAQAPKVISQNSTVVDEELLGLGAG